MARKGNRMTATKTTVLPGKKADRLDRLKRTHEIQSKSGKTERMTAFIIAEAEMVGATVEQDGENLYLTKGEAEIYPCFVAHTDTVHQIIEHFQVLELNGLLVGWNPVAGLQVGVGGDDKVGVWLALQMLNELPAGKAAFFYDEETGCKGARKADLSFFDDCAFILQGDRREYKDVVIRASGDDLCSAEFIVGVGEHLEKYGREFCKNGMMTDVQELTERKVGISALNLSCGYYRPHGSTEVVSISEAIRTLNFMRAITSTMGHQRWPHVNETKKWVSSYVKPEDKKIGPKKPATVRDDEYDYDAYGGGRYYDDHDDSWDGWVSHIDKDTGKTIWTPRGSKVEEKKLQGAKETKKSEKDGEFPSNRWRYSEPISTPEKAREVREKILKGNMEAHMASRQPKYPSMDLPQRSYYDNLIERLWCPECVEQAMTVDYLDQTQVKTIKLAICWSCGTSLWTVGDVLDFWKDSGVTNSQEAADFIDEIMDQIERGTGLEKLAVQIALGDGPVEPTKEVAKIMLLPDVAKEPEKITP